MQLLYMVSNSSKTLPSLSKCKTYANWLKLIKILLKFSDLPANWQGPALVLSLEYLPVSILDPVGKNPCQWYK